MGVSHTVSAETQLTYQRRRAGVGGEIWNSCSHTPHAARRSDDEHDGDEATTLMKSPYIATVARASIVTMKRWWPP